MKNRWSRYLILLAVVTVAVAGGMTALNYIADPYGIHHYGQAGDWTKSRPSIRLLERLHKAHAIRDAKADTLLLGNSRVIVGLDPQHPSLPQPAYNLGLGAANIYECQRYLQHAIHLHPPKLVIVAIDKGMFHAAAAPEGDFDEARLSVFANGQPNTSWQRVDVPDTLFSLNAVLASATTLAARGPRVTYAHGLRDEALMRPYLSTAKVLVENERWKAMSRKFEMLDASGQNAQFAAFRTILRVCAGAGIDVRVFTNPLHAGMLEIEYGDGRDFEAWLRQVAAVVAEESATNRREIPFWNFYGYNSITTEPFPDKSQPRSTLQNYWEISHYRKPIGDLVLSRVMGHSDPRLDAMPDFGHRVTAETVGQDLQRIAAERAQWRQTEPGASQP